MPYNKYYVIYSCNDSYYVIDTLRGLQGHNFYLNTIDERIMKVFWVEMLHMYSIYT